MNEEKRNQLSATEQPAPVSNNHPAVWEVVIEDITVRKFIQGDDRVVSAILKDMQDRDAWGRSKYKVPLQPFNGRDALVDMYQEFLDAIAYTKQFQLEGKAEDDEPMKILYHALLGGVTIIREKLLLRDGK